tara:strand:+ start:471 stop:716 length:246 start_codon:yes stop_codon:yes gene_type:complete
MFVKYNYKWSNQNMKNSLSSVKDKIISRYLSTAEEKDQIKSSDINVLLNRVRLDQKRESRKKILFSAAATTGVLLFGLIIF